jgi:predicted MPP superfamily phosphohydrolase
VIGFYGLLLVLHVYVGLRLIPDLPGGLPAQAALFLWLAASAIVMPYTFGARRARASARTDRLAWAGGLAMGMFSTLFVLTFLRDFVLVVGAVLGALSPALALHRDFRAASALAIPLLALLFAAVAVPGARKRAAVKQVDIPITGLPDALHGFTIAQITDIHVGPTIKRGYVDAIVDAVNELRADMVAVTGDMVDGSVPDLARHTAPLGRLSSRHGSYFVTGNHEYYSGADAWVKEMQRIGMRTLMNEHVVLDHEGESVVVAGVTDYGAGQFDKRHASDPGRAIHGAPGAAGVRLLLAHQPRSAFAARDAGFDLQLSGHTHGGQFLPWNFLVRLQQPFTAGLARLGKLWVYTSRGAGYWGPPMRLFAPSEITRLRLVRAT